MYHFLHKHRHWFFALVVLAVAALVWFQLKGDPGGPIPNVPANRPTQPAPAAGQ
ncbi:MAG TPA: hypothetical protein VMJ32_08065 [Pirellulales bacterium]|nr:hypothetical protein [Pirellulales bacterium]